MQPDALQKEFAEMLRGILQRPTDDRLHGWIPVALRPQYEGRIEPDQCARGRRHFAHIRQQRAAFRAFHFAPRQKIVDRLRILPA